MTDTPAEFTMRRNANRSAFSLIELLVVLTILALLMALTVGAVQRVREAGRRVERLTWIERRKNGETAPRSIPFKVMFIGNSYTSTHDLPGAVQALAEAAGGAEIVVGARMPGGLRLMDHWNAGGAEAAIRGDDWDFVVLQEQSQTPLPAFGRNEFYLPYAKKFGEVIREKNAIPMLYLTWTRPDTPGFVQRDWTVSVTDLARDMKAEVAAAGIAKELVEQQIPGFNFYADPGGHPTPAGTYLVACTFYAAIFDKSPEGLPASVTTSSGVVVGVPANQAAIVQKAAFDAQTQMKKLLDRDPERRKLR